MSATAKRIMRAFSISKISAADPPRTEQPTMQTSQSSAFVQKFGVEFTKEAISDHLASIASGRARDRGETYAKAYAAVLDGEMGRDLYSAYSRAPAGVARAIETPVSPAMSKAAAVSAELEQLARAHSEKHGISLGRSMEAVLRSPEGRKKYNQMRGAAV